MSFQVKIVYDLIDKVSSQIKSINSKINSTSLSVNSQASAFSNLSTIASNSFSSISNSINSVGSSLKDASGKLAPMSLGLGAIGGMALKSTANFETLALQLEALAGSSEKGQEMFKKLVKLGAETPFELAPLVKANNTMMGFGLSGESAFANLKRIGDIAAITGGDLQGITLAFSQSAAQGKLMGQEILQFINNGVPIIELLAKTINKPTSEIKKMVEKGLITFPILEKAFINATSQGGKFQNGMLRLSTTLSGVFSTLKDNVNIALSELGKDIVATTNLKENMKAFGNVIANLVEKFKALSPKTKKFIVYSGILITVLTPVLFIAGALISSFGLLFKGLAFVSGGFALFSRVLLFMPTAFSILLQGLTAIIGTLSLLKNVAVITLRSLLAFALANPFTAIIIATTIIYTYWDKIRAVFSGITGFIKQITFDDLIKAGNDILSLFKNVLNYVLEIANKFQIFKDIGTIFGGVKDFITGGSPTTIFNSNPAMPTAMANQNQSFNGNINVSFANMPKKTNIESNINNKAINLGTNSVFSR